MRESVWTTNFSPIWKMEMVCWLALTLTLSPEEQSQSQDFA